MLDATHIATVFVEHALRALDDMGDESAEDRLRLVAGAALVHFGCVGWWLGRGDGDLVVPVAHGARDEATRLRMQGAAGAPRPVRTTVVEGALEGGSLLAGRDHPASRRYSPRAGVAEVVAAGGYDVDARRWLLAIADDGGAYALRDARPALFAAVQAALGFPRGPRPGA